MDIEEIYLTCQKPKAGTSDIEAWNTLDGGASNTSVVKVGLFGYDITCLATYCALAGTENIYCPMIVARGLDGLAFGVKFEIDAASANYYCAGFHNEETTDIAVCNDVDSDFYTYNWSLNYTVADDYFTGSTEKNVHLESFGYYGMSEFLFSRTQYDSLDATDFVFNSAFRFIGAFENGGARWSVGDTIDMFYLDFEHNEVEQNNGFELAGATTLSLTAAGIALFSAVMM